jgi:hypothetical protein
LTSILSKAITLRLSIHGFSYRIGADLVQIALFSEAGVDECRVIDFPRYDAGWINNRQVLAAGLMGPVELHDTADGTS